MPNQDGITIKKLMCLHMKVILMEIIIDLLKIKYPAQRLPDSS